MKQSQLEMSAKMDQVLEESSSSVTRQASKISENDLMFMMQKMRCRVVWQDEPELTELLGAPPEEGGMWYAILPTVAEMLLEGV